MTALDALGDPTRRRILEHLAAAGELSAGGVVSLVGAEFPISQPAVSQHLAVLREAGLVAVRPQGAHRFYRVCPEPLAEAERWLADLRAFWSQRLDSLETELARGHREGRRRSQASRSTTTDHAPRRMA